MRVSQQREKRRERTYTVSAGKKRELAVLVFDKAQACAAAMHLQGN